MRSVCWRISAWDADIASVRYRCAIPARHLEALGVASRISWGTHGILEPGRPDVAIFVKAFGERDVGLARKAADAGVPVVLDVCDNVFAPNYRAHSPANLRSMAEAASAVVTTGSALTDVLRRELPRGLPVYVVPDPVETPEDVRFASRMLRRERLGRAIRRHPADLPLALAGVLRRDVAPAGRRLVAGIAPRSTSTHPRQVLWFGNVGSVEPRFGIVNLTDIAAELESAAGKVPFRLLVVTSDRKAYRKLIEPLRLPTAFAAWDRMTIFSHVRRSAAAILPNSRDEFSICKSANRAALALSQGVPVVATRIPSLDILEGCMLFDDFRAGVTSYLRQPELAASHVRRASEVLEREFAPSTVAARWREVIEAAAGGERPR